MNTDFRVNVAFFNHLKTKKLIQKLGKEGVFSLMSLWAYTAQNKPKGILTNLTKDDISILVDWEGEINHFLDVLIELKFLDKENNGEYSIHNWEQRNGFAYYAEERSEKARKAAEQRWKMEKEAKKKGASNGKK